MDYDLRSLQREAKAIPTPENINQYLSGLRQAGAEFIAFPLDIDTRSAAHPYNPINDTVFYPIPYLPGENLLDITGKERSLFENQHLIPQGERETYGSCSDDLLFPDIDNLNVICNICLQQISATAMDEHLAHAGIEHLHEEIDWPIWREQLKKMMMNDAIIEHANEAINENYTSLNSIASDFIDPINCAFVLTKNIAQFLWPLMDEFFTGDYGSAVSRFYYALRPYSIVEFRFISGETNYFCRADSSVATQEIILHDGPLSC